MKIEIGKTKITGFKFRNDTEGVYWLEQMDKYKGEEGIIISIHHEYFFQSVRVQFSDGNLFSYPLEMSKNYIINNELKDEKIMKRKAIIIGEEPQKESKGIEFTHYFNDYEWLSKFDLQPKNMKEIVVFPYGKTVIFLCNHAIYGKFIYKGNLNDGTY